MSDAPEPNRAVDASRMVQERDPYPRMIIACMGIALVLVTIIFGFIFFDLMGRSDSSARPVRPPATQPMDVPSGE